MAFVENLTALKAQFRLNNGSTASGGIRYKNVSGGKLNPSTWDVDKFGAIALALSPMFQLGMSSLQSIKTFDIEQQQ